MVASILEFSFVQTVSSAYGHITRKILPHTLLRQPIANGRQLCDSIELPCLLSSATHVITSHPALTGIPIHHTCEQYLPAYEMPIEFDQRR
jgi:hypothetical protein